jgi:hypothetical protein
MIGNDQRFAIGLTSALGQNTSIHPLIACQTYRFRIKNYAPRPYAGNSHMKAPPVLATFVHFQRAFGIYVVDHFYHLFARNQSRLSAS